ncbi:hypothetical protein CHUAL_000708 [Chamberlinius hualienensis]
MKSSIRYTHSEHGVSLIKGNWSPVRLGRFPIRLMVALMACFGVFNTNALRLNISIALVAMVNSSAIIAQSNHTVTSEMCVDRLANTNSSLHLDKDGPFEWDERYLGIILSAYFWGNVFGQIPGGILADKYGGKWPFGIGIGVSAICTVLIPTAAYVNVALVVALRVLCGLSQGLALPAVFSLMSKWVPKTERSRLTGITYAGVSLGKVAVFPISALLCESPLLDGWPLVFYVFGIVAVLWCVLWAFLVYDTPAEDPKVSGEELQHIQENLNNFKHVKKFKVNWLRLFSSPAVWAMLLAYFAQAWGANTLLTILPSYLKFALGFDLKSSGLINGLPHAVAFLFGLSASWAADWLRNSKMMSTTAVRKLFVGVAMLAPMGCLIGVTITPCNKLVLVVLLTFAVSLANLNAGGLFLNEMDLSLEISGTLKGLTSFCSNLSGIIAPYVAGVLVQHNESVYEWNRVFYLAACILCIGALTFLLLGTAQNLNLTKQSDDDDDEIVPILMENNNNRSIAEELHQ